MNIGIDRISFYTPNKFISLEKLAQKRNVDPNKYKIGIGQDQQSVVPEDEDAISMGANAAQQVLSSLDEQQLQSIDTLIFASESGVDNSKSGAIFLQELLNLSSNIRTIEMKQACYAGTYGLMNAVEHVALYPQSSVLVVASDIARYGLQTPGEVTQGAGAVAMLVTNNPHLAKINQDSVYISNDINDFWRPLGKSEAIVDGKYSTEVYKKYFSTLWRQYNDKNKLSLVDFKGIAFHLPYTKMGKKALDEVADETNDVYKHLYTSLTYSQIFNRRVGNLYTASVYLSLISMLSNHSNLSAGDRIGIFSYGSGAEAELYSITLSNDYKKYVLTDVNEMLNLREEIGIDDYEILFQATGENGIADKKNQPSNQTGRYYYAGIQDNARQYSRK